MKNKEIVYAAPTAKTVEINAQAIICQSGEYTVTGQDGIWEKED